MAAADEMLLSRIDTNPKVLGGKPVIRGTRISVSLIVNFVAHGMSFQDIIDEYPQLTIDDLRAAVLLAEKVA